MKKRIEMKVNTAWNMPIKTQGVVAIELVPGKKRFADLISYNLSTTEMEKLLETSAIIHTIPLNRNHELRIFIPAKNSGGTAHYWIMEK